MWDVVIWQEGRGDGMDYVPTSWGNYQGEYKWPKNCSRALMETLIDTCDPLIQYKYKMYKAVIKKSKIKSLTEAKAYCLKGLETSNLESNCDTESENDEKSDDEPIIHQTKKLNKPVASRMPDVRLNKRQFSFPISPATRSQSPIGGTSCNLEEEISGYSNHKHLNKQRLDITSTSTPQSTRVIPNSLAESRSSSNISTPTAHLRNLAEGSDGNLMYSKLCSIEFEVRELRRQMNARIDTLEKKVFEFSRKKSPDTAENCPLFLADLPVKNDAELIRIDKLIKTNGNDMDELVNSLYFCGGENVHKAIFAQMKKLLTKEVSLLYSGEGKKNKKSFVDLGIYSAITRAVRRRFKDTSDKDIKKTVSLFLAGAKDREGGRKARGSHTLSQHTTTPSEGAQEEGEEPEEEDDPGLTE